MADTRTLAAAGTRSLPHRSPRAWIKRRARRLSAAFHAGRREAVQAAALDWRALNLRGSR